MAKFYHITTYGCQMNVHESEKIAGILSELGYESCENIEDADVAVFNTCCIRENAENHAFGNIGMLKKLKRNKKEMIIAVGGCLTQQLGKAGVLHEKFPYVDIIFGTHNLNKLKYLILKKQKQKKAVIEVEESEGAISEDEKPLRTSYPNAWINITYGCNNFCSYCIVPYVRGRERSREPEDILREIRRLAADGVVEIMLLGQNVNSYGKNLKEPMSFAGLLREVEKIEGVERIRFMTSHPKDLSDELIQVMKESRKICRHLHLPLQSGSTRILERMNRRYTKEQYVALAEKIRREIPDIAITTDIIVGFPGETMEDVEETIDVIRRVKYDNAFTFIYSKRTGTPAAAMEDQVPEKQVKEGFERVLKVVQDTARAQVARYQGQTAEVLVEEINAQDEGLLTGRMSNNTLVHFPGPPELIGRIVLVALDKCQGFYYMGRMVL